MPPQPQPLIGFFGCSVLVHASAALSAVAMTGVYAMLGTMVPSCQHKPEFEALEVSMVSLPKSKNDSPDREARVKAATGREAPTPEPPPVKESDLVIHQEKPPPDPGNADELRRQQILEEIERRRMLEELENAPEGAQDRNATDPDGQEDLEMAIIGAGARGDPEFAAWQAKVFNLMKPNFHPLASPAGTQCVVNIKMDPASGRILSAEITAPSGILPFDAAAERAVNEVQTLPLPPEKYREWIAREGVGIRFTPP